MTPTWVRAGTTPAPAVLQGYVDADGAVFANVALRSAAGRAVLTMSGSPFLPVGTKYHRSSLLLHENELGACALIVSP